MVEQQFKIGYIAREQVAASKWWYSVQSTYNQEQDVNDLYTRVMIKGAFDDKKKLRKCHTNICRGQITSREFNSTISSNTRFICFLGVHVATIFGYYLGK